LCATTYPRGIKSRGLAVDLLNQEFGGVIQNFFLPFANDDSEAITHILASRLGHAYS